MIEIYATPYKGKPERLEVAVVEAEVLLCHNDNRWIRLRPSVAQEFGETLMRAAAEARTSSRPKTDDEMNQSFGGASLRAQNEDWEGATDERRVEMAKAEPVSGEPRPTPPTLDPAGDGATVSGGEPR